MSSLPTKWQEPKKKALDALVNNPSKSVSDIADEVGIHRTQIHRWLREPEFVELYYERYMVTFGARLPKVLTSMIREAEAGNVQAGRLVLEHSGKLIKRVEVKQRKSPFEKFLSSDVSVESISEADFEVLPQRPETPVKPPTPLTKTAIRKEITKKDLKNKKRREARQWRARAKAVGVSPAKGGRQTPKQREDWKNAVIEAEKRLNTPTKK